MSEKLPQKSIEADKKIEQEIMDTIDEELVRLKSFKAKEHHVKRLKVILSSEKEKKDLTPENLLNTMRTWGIHSEDLEEIFEQLQIDEFNYDHVQKMAFCFAELLDEIRELEAEANVLGKVALNKAE